MRVPVVENVLKLNDEIASLNRANFAHAGVFVVDVMGAPGCGKTALIEKTIQRIGDEISRLFFPATNADTGPAT